MRKAILLTVLLGGIIPGQDLAAQDPYPPADKWVIESQEDWQTSVSCHSNMEITEGRAVPTGSEADLVSVIKRFPEKRSAGSITLTQSPEWLNWDSVPNLGPSNLRNAPVTLQAGEGNYWIFGQYKKSVSQQNGTFVPEPATVEGFNRELLTTPHPMQYDAPGGLKPGKGGYHAWQSRDMETWVHHGPVSEFFSRWMTTAEYEDGKFYLYYDFPNDQDPHLYIDDDPFDGLPGKNMGIAFKDPTHGSDCGMIRDLDGNFHIIVEDWSPIHAQSRNWDSPLALHAVSINGIDNFKILDPPVDERTHPTGEMGTYTHPHWVKEDPDNYTTNVAEYEIHEPEQDAFGDWAAIAVGGQYYLFSDYDPAGRHRQEDMSVAWFTSDHIQKQFTFCGHMGQGHPDPDILFAEGRFYLVTQMETDYVSQGPWVESVEVRVGVDSSDDGVIDQWTDWQQVTEEYNYVEGFAKQVAVTPARLDLSGMPEGYGFCFEVKVTDTNENESRPILDKVVFSFGN